MSRYRVTTKYTCFGSVEDLRYPSCGLYIPAWVGVQRPRVVSYADHGSTSSRTSGRTTLGTGVEVPTPLEEAISEEARLKEELRKANDAVEDANRRYKDKSATADGVIINYRAGTATRAEVDNALDASSSALDALEKAYKARRVVEDAYHKAIYRRIELESQN
jgi:hypothetical protein